MQLEWNETNEFFNGICQKIIKEKELVDLVGLEPALVPFLEGAFVEFMKREEIVKKEAG